MRAEIERSINHQIKRPEFRLRVVLQLGPQTPQMSIAFAIEKARFDRARAGKCHVDDGERPNHNHKKTTKETKDAETGSGGGGESRADLGCLAPPLWIETNQL